MANLGVRTFGKCLALASMAVLVLTGCGGAESRKLHFLERGREYLAQGRYDKANIEFRNALQIAPSDPEARYDSGVAAENLAAYMEAAKLYEGALDIAPDHLEARRHLARLLFLGGQFKMAVDTANPGLAKHPDDSVLLGVRAGARARMQADLSEAVVDAEHAVKSDPHNAEAVQILAGLYARQNRSSDVINVLQRGVADNPKSVAVHLALAEYYNANGHPQETERLLKEIVALAPRNPDYRIMLARFYASGDRVDDSEATLRKGLAELPKDRALTQALVDLLHARRGTAAAERELRSMLAANPNDDELSFVLASLFLSDQQTDKAREVFLSVVNRHDSTAAVLRAKSYLAGLRMEANDIPGAQALIKEVLAEDARNSDALQLRAQLALLQQRSGDAIVDLRNVLKDQPNDSTALRLLAKAHVANHEPALALEVLERGVDANQNDNNLRLDLAMLLMSQGKPDQAQPFAEVLVQRDPGNPLYLRAAFGAELANKNFAAAAHTAELFVARVPGRPEGYYLAGLAADANNNSDVAIQQFEKSLAIAPAAHEPLEALVRSYSQAGKVGAALERLARFEGAQPQDPLPRVLAGELLLAQGKPAEAAAEFKAAIALDPAALPPYRGLARTQFLQHDVEGALQTLRGAQTRVRAPENAALDVANLYQSIGRADDARKAYEEALRLNPKLDLAANNLAMLLVSRSDQASLDRALTLAQRFDSSSNPYQVDTLGWVRFKRGETSSALQLLGKALELAPGSAAVRYHLAMAQLKAGQTETARDNLQQALKSSNNFEGVGEARTVLAGLQPAASALPH